MAVNTSLFTSGIGSISSGVSSLFQGLYTAPAEAAAATAQQQMVEASSSADILQAQVDILEGQTYGAAASLANLNAGYTAASTNIQAAQADRSLFMQIGSERAAAAGSGSSGGGSAADIFRNSAQQGALNKAVIQTQGLITQAGYQEQAQSYGLMQQASGVAAQAQQVAATGETQAAAEYGQEANLFKESETGDFISAAISGVAGIAELGMGFAGVGTH